MYNSNDILQACKSAGRGRDEAQGRRNSQPVNTCLRVLGVYGVGRL